MPVMETRFCELMLSLQPNAAVEPWNSGFVRPPATSYSLTDFESPDKIIATLQSFNYIITA